MDVKAVENQTWDVGWSHCPTEILVAVFREMDSKNLENCMRVCKRWMDIADHVGEHHGQWKRLVENNMVNKGITYRQKSILKWRNLYVNSQLWLNVRYSQLELVNTYSFNEIHSINVYQDNLIVILKDSVKYINSDAFKIVRILNISCLDFNENDHIIIKVLPHINQNFCRLILNGKKSTTDFNINDDETSHISENVVTYKLNGGICYILDSNNMLWRLRWFERKWIKDFLIRYYGYNGGVRGISVYCDDIYIVFKLGDVYRVELESLLLIKETNLDIPDYKTNMKPVMFHRCSVIVGVPDSYEFQLNKNAGTDYMVLECPRLTCAREHGDVIFLGFNNGKVEICLPNNMTVNGVIPELKINIADYDKHLSDWSIVSVDVYEAFNAHHVFVATSANIYQILINHTMYT